MNPAQPLPATLSLDHAAAEVWDIAIVGAGPAGAAAARTLAQRGLAVLLIDKSPFPRGKVCGCCLNASALASLEALGAGDLPQRLGAPPLQTLHLAAGGRPARLRLGGGVSLSREALDAALVRHAIAATAHFLPDTHARLADIHEDHRKITLRQAGAEAAIAARLVLAADGLGGHLLDDQAGLDMPAEVDSRIGAGLVLPAAPADYREGTIYMACGRGGYAGMVRLEDGRLDVAAALDPIHVKESGGPGPAVAALLANAGLPAIGELAAQPWRGTPRLTRRRLRLGARRLLVLGDAAGYVEPFTGEGIAWALASALALAPLAAQAARSWSDRFVEQWEAIHARRLGRRQRTCRMVTRLLRRPALTRATVSLLALAPALANPVVSLISDF